MQRWRKLAAPKYGLELVTPHSLENLACYEQTQRNVEADPLRRELAEIKAKAEKPEAGNAQIPSKASGP